MIKSEMGSVSMRGTTPVLVSELAFMVKGMRESFAKEYGESAAEELISEAIEAQERYCKKNCLPYFAPDDGICYRCNKNIYEKIKRNGTSIERGISVEAAGTNLITGCPHCSWSFCE